MVTAANEIQIVHGQHKWASADVIEKMNEDEKNLKTIHK